jgi:hypothetical protein
VRPEFAVYALLVPIGLFIFARDKSERANALLIGASTAVVLIGQLVFNQSYFGSAVPLPFYAKVGDLYEGTAFYSRIDRFVKGWLADFITEYRYAIGLILVYVLFFPRRWLKNTSPAEKMILVASVFLLGYYVFFVHQVQGGSGRFYYHTLPAILFLACRALVGLWAALPLALQQEIAQPSKKWLVLLFTVLLILISPLNSAFALTGKIRSFLSREPLLPSYDLSAIDLPVDYDYTWFALPEFSKLPSDLVIASQDMGLVGVMNLDKRVIDIAGLTEPAFSLQKFSADTLFSEPYRPDLLYMPYGYDRYITEILNHPFFLAHYDYIPKEMINAFAGVALYRDSKYYAQMRQIVNSAMWEILAARWQGIQITR